MSEVDNQAKAGPPYKDATLPVDQRVEDLLGRMTLEEKVAQIVGIWPAELPNSAFEGAGLAGPDGAIVPEKAEELLLNGIGHVLLTFHGRTATDNARFTNGIQRHLLENTRLGIPALIFGEGLHGCWMPEATSFPQAIGLAGTWNPDLIEDVFTVVAAEARSRGVHQLLSPVLDIARDPRWGRTEETYGEDPYLVSRMAVACVRGLQGPGPDLDGQRVISTLKHFVGYGQSENGTNCGPANYSERVLREVSLAPFEAAVKEAGVWSVMPSYNEIDGVPSTANTWLLQDILRDEWQFKGSVVTDYCAIDELYMRHCVADGVPEAGRMALEAGVDMETGTSRCYRGLMERIREHALDESMMDAAVARVLHAKFSLGLFDRRYVEVDHADEVSRRGGHSDLALLAAHQAVTLLKNEGKLLPLNRDSINSIAVIGPNAADVRLGGYSGKPRDPVSVLRGIQEKVGDTVSVVYAEGCVINEGPCDPWLVHEVIPGDQAKDLERITEAVEAARSADIAVLCLGGNEVTCRESIAADTAAGFTHFGDRASLELIGRQDDLVRAVVETGTPTVALVFSGRPLAINYVTQSVPSVFQCWYLGQETGRAVADILFGDYNPAGRLPISIPRSSGQLPVFYNHKPSARRGYLFDEIKPLFPFGYGLSYTDFAYSNIHILPQSIRPDEVARVFVDVTNTGDMAGDEVVQLYIRDCVSSVTRPVKELKDFRRIHLAPGETETVEFAVSPGKLAFWNADMNYTVEPGEFQIMVGPNSEELTTAALTVVTA